MNLEDLDKLFREKFSQKRVDFDESSWAEMEELLNKRRPRQNRYGWLLLMPLLAVLGVGGYWFANNGANSMGDGSSQSQEAVAAADAGDQDQKQQRPSNLSSLLLGLDQTATKAEVESANPKLPEANNHRQTINNKTGSAKGPRKPATNNRNKIANNREQVSYKTADNQADQQESNMNHEESSAGADGKDQFTADVTFIKLPTIGSHIKPVDMDPGMAGTLKDSIKAENPDIPEPFEIGLAVGGQLSGNSVSSDLSAGPVVGAYMSWHLFDDLYLNTELLYHYDPSPDYERSVQERSYSFGFKGQTTNLRLKDVHYFQLPVYADYDVLGSHGIVGGLKGSYLLTSTGKFTTKKASSLGAQTSDVSTAKIQPDGLNSLQLDAMIGYRFDYSDRLSIQLRGLFGLSQPQNNDVETINSYERSPGIQFMLQYQLN